MKPVVIFGIGKTADVIATYAIRDHAWPIAGFVVDDAHATVGAFHDRPVVPWSRMDRHFPAATYRVFVAVGYQRLNRLRGERIARARDAGYELASLVTAHAHVAPGVAIGGNSAVLDAACVQPGARIGDGSFVWTGAMIGHHQSLIHI
jgi:UDP-3-O-[3-hydroxymyristoyl] glucosamine N-acyltransferase